MEREKHCLLCWKPLNIGDSLIGVHEHYQQLINCCKELLKDKHKSELEELEFCEGEPLPFCIDCFTYSEKLYEIQKQLKDLRNCLEGWIDAFETGISNSRMLYLRTSSNLYDHLNIRKENEDSATTSTRPTSDNCNSTIKFDKSTEKGKSKIGKRSRHSVVHNLPAGNTGVCEISNSMSMSMNELKIDGNTNVKKKSNGNKLDSADVIVSDKSDTSLLRKRKAKTQNLEEQEKFDEHSRGNISSKRRKSGGEKDLIDLDEGSSERGNYEVDNLKSQENNSDTNQKSNKTGNEPLTETLKCSVCSLELCSRKDLKFHREETGHVTEKSVNCPQCKKKFYRKAACETHIQAVHTFQPEYCYVCGVRFHTYKKLRMHAKKHGGRYSFFNDVHKCAICHVKWMSMSALYEHMKANHGNVTPFKCDKCHRLYYTEETFSVHKSIHENTEMDDALIEKFDQSEPPGWILANIGESNEMIVKSSIPLKKMRYGFRCEVCDILLDCEEDFDLHVTTTGHRHEKDIQCNSCNEKVYRFRDHYHHICSTSTKHPKINNTDSNQKSDKDKTGDETVTEPLECSLEICSHKYFRSHIEQTGYTAKKAGNCPQCKMTSLLKADYEADVKNHSKRSKFSSSVNKCEDDNHEKSKGKNKSETGKDLGHTVVQNLSPDTDMKCDISDSMSVNELESDGNTNVQRTSKSMCLMLELSKNLQPEFCKVCGKKFDNYQKLQTHALGHGYNHNNPLFYRVHKCDICHVKWMSMSALFIHMKANHGDVTPYKCDICPRLYYTEETFNVHKSIHKKSQMDKTFFEGSNPPESNGWILENTEDQKEIIKKSSIISLKKMRYGFRCEVCDILLEREEDFDLHLTKTGHRHKKEIQCNCCNQKFYRLVDQQ